jgi:hypothetical protein
LHAGAIVEHFVTVILATIGTVLGCINTCDLLNKRRVRLRVVPRSAIPDQGGVWTNSTQHIPGGAVCIEVTNLSSFPVTIDEVGYTLPSRRRATIIKPILLDSKGWPRRLEPRDSVTVYGDVADIPRNIGKAFARTACGVTRFGNSPALDDLKHHWRQHLK